MEQYISKAAVVAEINRVLNSYDPNEITSGRYALVDLRDFLDTLETKEVDFEKELDKYTADNFWALEGNNESPYLVEKDDMLKVVKHFFELGLRAKDMNEIIKTAEDHAYFAGSENTREKLIYKACEWLNDNLHHYWGSISADPHNFLFDFRKVMEDKL